MAVTYRISELAADLAVTTRTIRFYEEQGLISPSRRGHERIYTPHERQLLRIALTGKQLGLTLAECRELLILFQADSAEMSGEQRHEQQERIAHYQQFLSEQKRAISTLASTLNNMRARADDDDAVATSTLDKPAVEDISLAAKKEETPLHTPRSASLDSPAPPPHVRKDGAIAAASPHAGQSTVLATQTEASATSLSSHAMSRPPMPSDDLDLFSLINEDMSLDEQKERIKEDDSVRIEDDGQMSFLL